MQSSRGGEPHLVLTMEQHTATAAALAGHFGGVPGFTRLEPADLMLGLVREHDRGWVPVDAEAPRDPSTDLPWSVYQTPIAVSIGTGPRSIDHNERCHPYRGLLASMHIVGLFTGRYGLDATRVLDLLGDDSRALLEPILEREQARQVRLRAALAADPATAAWVAEPALMHNYRALQFFDRLALWLQVTCPQERRATVIPDVPTAVGSPGVDVTVTPLGPGRVGLAPYPFDATPLEVVSEGRWLHPQPREVDLAAALSSAPAARQPTTLVPA